MTTTSTPEPSPYGKVIPPDSWWRNWGGRRVIPAPDPTALPREHYED